MGRAWACILLLLASSSVYASPEQSPLTTVRGASYLGLCSPAWPCEESLKALPHHGVKAIGWLANTFSHQCPCARKFLSMSGEKYVRVHLANCTCFPERGRKCGKYEPFAGETLKSTDRKLRKGNRRLLKRYRSSVRHVSETLTEAVRKTTIVRVALCLESPLSKRAREALLAETLAFFPPEEIVDSVVSGECLKGLICEKHGLSVKGLKPPCIIDTDGIDYRSGKVNAGGCESAFFWSPSFNLLPPPGSPFLDPLKRTAGPTSKDLHDLKAALRP